VRVNAFATRWGFIAAGWTCLGLGVLGIFLPVLPTTPLVLLAAWCFSRGSQRLHRWLLEHRLFGPIVRDWEQHHVISRRAKILATATIVPLVGYMLVFTAAAPWAKVLAGALALWGLVFIWTKPSQAPLRDPA